MNVRNVGRVAAVLVALSSTMPVRAVHAQSAEGLDIPFEKFVLDNGLTLIVHEDHKAPIVAVNVWYHVGSKNERPGKTGFAHLFEHLMFNGSENYDDDYYKVLQPLGAVDANGTTNNDRTNYFQTVPTSALDVVLWMESDRMGHLTGVIDQDRLDEQRGVVQNEKRQGDNRPYGQVSNRILENTYPVGHPYSWSVIGSMEDLDAASLEDVYHWFGAYYGAANAVIVLAGDIDAETAREKVELYFGDIPAGPPVTRQDVWVAPRTGSTRMSMEDRVPQARVYKVWNVPKWGSEEATELGLFARVLASGKTSRLSQRLVYGGQMASGVSARLRERELGSQFTVTVTALPGQDLHAIEIALDEELDRLLLEGPTEDELAIAQTQYRASFIRGVERIGGFGGKSDVLAMNEVFASDPGHYETRLRVTAEARPEDVRQTAVDWLSDGEFVLEVHPYSQGQVTASSVDRSRVPEAGTPPVADFPEIERARLGNGLEVVFSRRDAVPVVDFRMMVDAGSASDAWTAAGTASLAMGMLDEGTNSRTALEISGELQQLGARLGARTTLDVSYVTLSALRENLNRSVDLFADVILNPSFSRSDFERLQRQALAGIQQESVRPAAMALRVLPKLMYGDGHPYALPLMGSGTAESVSALTKDDLQRFHSTWFKPNNARLLVVGNTTMDEVMALAEDAFGDWEQGDVPDQTLPVVERQSGQTVYIMDRPDAVQSEIFAGFVIPPRSDPEDLAISTMNTVLGGDFTARVNMNLREDKRWSYGAYTQIVQASGQRPFLVVAPVQSDRTTESVQEVVGELRGIVGDRPVTSEERDRVIRGRALTLPGRWETNGAVLASLAEMERFELPDDHFDTLAARLRSMTVEQLNAAARRVIQPDGVIWVVVGDKASIEEGLRGLDLGPVYEIDVDGNVMGRLVR